MKKLITILLILLVIGGIFIGTNKPSNWYDDLNYYNATKIFLRKQINYPDTFEFLEYPDAEFGTKEERTIQVTGNFKCANAYGVYTEYRYVIIFEVRNNWIVKYYLIV